MSHRKNTISLSTVTAHLLVASCALLFCSCLPSSADGFQLTPTSALPEEDQVSAWSESDEGEATISSESSLGFLETGELPQSIDQLRAMQVRFKSLAEQVKDATVSITMRTGQGTGVLVSSDGVILTAAHVIGGPRRGALITFRDGKRARAVTLGVEAGTDSGMLKIMEMLEDKPDTETKDDEPSESAEEIAPGELPAPGESTETDNEEAPGGDDVLDQELSQSDTDSADSEEDVIVKAFASEGLPFFEYLDVGVSTDLQEGQWVMAVGHPGGLDEERGMVVRVGRIINQNATSLRTDCTLVGGDSGGPLVNMEGSVVAIHSRIGGRIQDNIHVPVNVFLDTWEKLASGFKIGEQGRLGLAVSSDSNIVSDVQKGGPADKAGIQVGDILSGIGAQNVNNKRSLKLALQGRFPYEKLPIRVIRGSQKVDLTAMLIDTELLEAIKRRQMFLKSRKLQRER